MVLLNGRQAKRRVIALLQCKPDIHQPGRLLDHLMNELGITTDNTGKQRAILSNTLVKLETAGAVELERAGRVINRVRLSDVSATSGRPTIPRQFSRR